MGEFPHAPDMISSRGADIYPTVCLCETKSPDIALSLSWHELMYTVS